MRADGLGSEISEYEADVLVYAETRIWRDAANEKRQATLVWVCLEVPQDRREGAAFRVGDVVVVRHRLVLAQEMESFVSRHFVRDASRT